MYMNICMCWGKMLCNVCECKKYTLYISTKKVSKKYKHWTRSKKKVCEIGAKSVNLFSDRIAFCATAFLQSLCSLVHLWVHFSFNILVTQHQEQMEHFLPSVACSKRIQNVLQNVQHSCSMFRKWGMKEKWTKTVSEMPSWQEWQPGTRHQIRDHEKRVNAALFFFLLSSPVAPFLLIHEEGKRVGPKFHSWGCCFAHLTSQTPARRERKESQVKISEVNFMTFVVRGPADGHPKSGLSFSFLFPRFSLQNMSRLMAGGSYTSSLWLDQRDERWGSGENDTWTRGERDTWPLSPGRCFVSNTLPLHLSVSFSWQMAVRKR